MFGGDDRVPDFLGRTLGPWLAPAFRREEQAVLALDQDVVKVQEGWWFQNDGRTDQAGRPQEQSAPTGDHAIRQAEVGSALAGAIEDEPLNA